MKKFLQHFWEKVLYYKELVFGVPIAIGFLLAISYLAMLLQSVPVFPTALTEDVGMIVKYAIRGVGLVIAFAVAGFFKSWLAGDVDAEDTYWNKLLVDSLTLWIFVALSILAVFGSSLWL